PFDQPSKVTAAAAAAKAEIPAADGVRVGTATCRPHASPAAMLRPCNTSRRTADCIDDEAERGRRVVVDVGPPCCRSVVPGAGPVTGIAAVHGLLAGRSAVADDAATERVE